MIKKLKNNKLSAIIVWAFLLLICLISQKIITKKELMIDKMAYDILVKKLRNPTLTLFMKLITKLSNINVIVSLAIIFFIIFYYIMKNKKLAITIPMNLVIVTLLNQTLKFIVRRDRPVGYRLIEEFGYSFPSGHAMVSMAFYGLLIYIIHHLVKNKLLKNALIILNILIIILIGLSRIYLGVHYLSDVLTGYSISIIYLLILSKILNKYQIIP